MNDTPTPLDADDIFELTWHPTLTHPLPIWRGAVNAHDDALVFDVREGADGGPWWLLRTWDYTVEANPIERGSRR